MRTLRLRAAFMRGGTSKAVVFRKQDLPANPAELGRHFPSGDGFA